MNCPKLSTLNSLLWIEALRVQQVWGPRRNAVMLTCSNMRSTPEDPESSVQHSALCACQQGFWCSFVISIDSGEWQMVIMGAWDRLPLWEWLTSQPSLLPSVPGVWLAIVLCVPSTGAKAWCAILSLRSTVRRTPRLLSFSAFLPAVKSSVNMEARPVGMYCMLMSNVFLLLRICQQALGQLKVFTVNSFDDHSSAATVLQFIPLRFLCQKSHENVGH